MKLAELEVYIDEYERVLNGGATKLRELRARVITWHGAGDTAEASYGPNLLPAGTVNLARATRIAEAKLRDKADKLVIHVEPALVKARTLNERAIATPRSQYGWRSSGR